jgi:transcription elongation factor Elf1
MPKLQPLTYLCACGTYQTQYVWSDKEDEAKFDCEKCNKQVSVKNIVKSKVEVAAIRTPTKNR